MQLEEKQNIILKIIDLLLSNFSINFINPLLAKHNLPTIEEDSPDQEYDLMFLLKYEAPELVLKIKKDLEKYLALDSDLPASIAQIIKDIVSKSQPESFEKYKSRIKEEEQNYLLVSREFETDQVELLYQKIKETACTGIMPHAVFEKLLTNLYKETGTIDISSIYSIRKSVLKLHQDDRGDIPKAIYTRMRTKALKYYPYDYSMQLLNLVKQKKDYTELQQDDRRDIPKDIYARMRAKASKHYPYDYSMQLLNLVKQKIEYAQLQQDDRRDIPKDIYARMRAKAQEAYPDDYRLQLSYLKTLKRKYYK